ncbi:MAG: hypothetical protein ACWGSD_14495 [Thermodesulfobacteriota bacterium]
MKTKYSPLTALLVLSLLVPLLAAPGLAAADDDIDYGPMEAYLPTTAEMSAWVNQMWFLGAFGKYGYRMPGTVPDYKGAHYVLDKFMRFGLEDTFLEPVPATFSFPTSWNLKIRAGGKKKMNKVEKIDCSFLRYAGITPKNGVKAEMVYVGTGSVAEFDAAGDVAGKIVLVDIIAPPMTVAALEPATLFKYDPGDTLTGDNATENWPPINFDSTYHLAADRGAVGYIAVITFMADYNNQYLHWYADGSLPGLSVSPRDGDHLKSLLASGPVEATMKLRGRERSGSIYNVYGTVPGKHYGTDEDQFIVVQTHYDGWACNEASGTSVVLALAKYFAQFPPEDREYSLLFCNMGSHFGKKADWSEYDCLVYSLIQQGRVKAAAVVEMVGKQYKIIDGKYVDMDRICPRAFMVTLTEPTYPSPLVGIASTAAVKYDLERTVVIPIFFGEAGRWPPLGVPTVGHISQNAMQFSNEDTPETVMTDALRPTAAAFADMIEAMEATF